MPVLKRGAAAATAGDRPPCEEKSREIRGEGDGDCSAASNIMQSMDDRMLSKNGEDSNEWSEDAENVESCEEEGTHANDMYGTDKQHGDSVGGLTPKKGSKPKLATNKTKRITKKHTHLEGSFMHRKMLSDISRNMGGGVVESGIEIAIELRVRDICRVVLKQSHKSIILGAQRKLITTDSIRGSDMPLRI